MKIVHSFWSKPFQTGNRGKEDILFTLLSFAFSCLQARKFYGKVELVTDRKGQELFIEELELPYTSCATPLDNLNDYESDLFALGKIYAYSIQDEPFLHIDGDVFLWKEFDKKVYSAPLTVLHRESYPLYTTGYAMALREIRAKFRYTPDCLSDISIDKDLIAVNASVMGGVDVLFYRRFKEEVVRFIDNNSDRSSLSAPWMFNVVFEQLLFYYMVNKKESINFCLEESVQLYSFFGLPRSNNLIHVRTDKRHYGAHLALRDKMLNAYPSYYFKIVKLAKCMAL